MISKPSAGMTSRHMKLQRAMEASKIEGRPMGKRRLAEVVSAQHTYSSWAKVWIGGDLCVKACAISSYGPATTVYPHVRPRA
jgi:hypothetical protein